jgi:hypothetical protein
MYLSDAKQLRRIKRSDSVCRDVADDEVQSYSTPEPFYGSIMRNEAVSTQSPVERKKVYRTKPVRRPGGGYGAVTQQEG